MDNAQRKMRSGVLIEESTTSFIYHIYLLISLKFLAGEYIKTGVFIFTSEATRLSK